MDCTALRTQLDDYVDGLLSPSEAALCQQHISECADCRHVVEGEMLLRQSLKMMPVEQVPEGFEERILGSIREAETDANRVSRTQNTWAGLALAASVVVGVAIATVSGVSDFDGPASEAVAQVDTQIRVPAGVTQPVKIMFNAPHELLHVAIKVELPEGVEFPNNPKLRQLEWYANLKAGANVLELPVKLTGDGGVLVASLSFGEDSKKYSVELVAERGSWNDSDGQNQAIYAGLTGVLELGT